MFESPKTIQEISLNLNMGNNNINDQIKGYSLKNRHIPGLLDLNIIKIKEIGWKGAAIYCIKNKEGALDFLKKEKFNEI